MDIKRKARQILDDDQGQSALDQAHVCLDQACGVGAVVDPIRMRWLRIHDVNSRPGTLKKLDPIDAAKDRFKVTLEAPYRAVRGSKQLRLTANPMQELAV
ncbi:MAG: hypothetical protein E4G99_11430 [Anaerolineales bacterium]|nr:MAG: hypothetical protein E4G99_11430 [Anaerolineales bacterium]